MVEKHPEGDISDEAGRSFMVKIRTLFMEKGVASDLGWRAAEPLKIMPVKEVAEISMSDEETTIETDERQIRTVRVHQRGSEKSNRPRTPGR